MNFDECMEQLYKNQQNMANKFDHSHRETPPNPFKQAVYTICLNNVQEHMMIVQTMRDEFRELSAEMRRAAGGVS